MKLPRIFLKSFIVIIALAAIYLSFTFLFFMPRIEQNTMLLEDSIGKAQLQKTVDIIQNSSMELHNYEIIALQQRKDELKRLSSVIYGIIHENYLKSLKTPKDTKSIQQTTLKLISKIQYANNDYFYVSDYSSVLISHPYLSNKDFSHIKDLYGNFIVPRLVTIAREQNEGYIRYWWKKNTSDQTPYEKLTYARIFTPWEWVLGTGVYIDDIEKELQRRKQALVTRLGNILRKTKIGNNGYVYIFDSAGNMIIHPNTMLEGKNFKKWKNPAKGSFIFDDLIHAYKNGNKTLFYNWDRPDDKQNFSYKKISWIEYDSDFDWYICSSAYLDEFHQYSDSIKSFIIYSALLISLLIIVISIYFLRQIFYPIVALSHNTQEVINGNLDARYEGIINSDETGLLATQFNHMLDTINEQIATRGNKVKEKTHELIEALHAKEILLRELNHRVKNNLYVISSIIGLQSFAKEKIGIKDFIQTIQNRIQSMALGHEMLSNSEDLYRLEAQEYIPELTQSLIQAYMKSPTSCHCIYNISSIKLDIDKLISCGLIVNELVTNAIKYAFKDDNNSLHISLEEIEGQPAKLQLTVSDNGSGFDTKQTHGIGLELVEMLTHQLNGIITYKIHKGTSISIIFPR